MRERLGRTRCFIYIPVILNDMASKHPPQSAREFQQELGELVREAEDEGINLSCARDVDACEDGYRYMVEISRVQDS